MDEFAQSRGDDDLFADDIEPVEESTTTIIPEPVRPGNAPSSPQHKPSTYRNNPQYAPRPNQPQGSGRGRNGHGQGRGGRGGGLGSSRFAPQQVPAQPASIQPASIQPAPVQTAPTQAPIQAPAPGKSEDQTTSTETPAEAAPTSPQDPVDSEAPTNTDSTPPINAPTAPAVLRGTPAVRGNRSLTGGPPIKKLSETELTDRLAKMSIINADKSAKFARAERDSALFQRKEQESKAKQREEEKFGRELEKERERNRARKLKAQGGREWDSEKVGEEFREEGRRGGRSEYVRGGHGGVINMSIRGRGGLESSRFASTGGGERENPGDGTQARGRGGGRGRGRGRGGNSGFGGSSTNGGSNAHKELFPTHDDFPSLPSAPQKLTESNVSKVPGPSLDSPLAGAGNWAEEMATGPPEASAAQAQAQAQ